MHPCLFVIYIGGSHTKSLIEVHDIRIVIANTIENTYPTLRESWWGRPETLHLDAWGELHHVDGYDIILRDHPQSETEQQLYFVNLGGYNEQLFTELHENVFVIAKSPMEAKVKAKEKIAHWFSPHQDYQYEVDKIYLVNELLNEKQYHIHLQPSMEKRPFKFTCRYTPIGRIEEYA